jgi:hypothetical protein
MMLEKGQFMKPLSLCNMLVVVRSLFNSDGVLVVHLLSAVAPPWFSGTLQQGLAAALAPLKHVAYIVS